MKAVSLETGLLHKQKGALILVTLIILLVVSLLGMSSVDSTGLEMQMSSNSRLQQQTFEAAEYTLSWVENNLATTGYFSKASVTNNTDDTASEGFCGTACFSSACTNGYCFNGTYTPGSLWSACTLGVPATEPNADAALWADGSGKHRTLAIPNTTITAKYIIEFACYTAKDPAQDINLVGNQARVYKITAYVVGEGGGARVMLRSAVADI